jgi:hypothetical protein
MGTHIFTIEAMVSRRQLDAREGTLALAFNNTLRTYLYDPARQSLKIQGDYNLNFAVTFVQMLEDRRVLAAGLHHVSLLELRGEKEIRSVWNVYINE